MSFPERLTLSHLIDGENEKDFAITKEHRVDSVQHRNMSSSDTSAAAATVDGDAGKSVVFVGACCCCEALRQWCVASTKCSTIGDWAFPVAAGQA